MTIASKLERSVGALRSSAGTLKSVLFRRWLKSKGMQVGRQPRMKGLPRIRLIAGSHVSAGDNLVLSNTVWANTLESRGPCILRTTHPEAFITFGKDVGISSATISALNGITIGDRVLIGTGAVITDNDHHKL